MESLSMHTTPENLNWCLWKTWAWQPQNHRNVFCPHGPQFEEQFERLPFHDICMDGRPNHGNKAVFSNFSGIVCTGT